MTVQDTRRANLKRLTDASSISDVAKRTGRPISQICDAIYGRKAFGEKLARRMEVELGLPSGDLDCESGTSGVQMVESKQYRLPLVSWDTAALAQQLIEEYLMSEVERPHAFAVKVRDESMAPLFTTGDVLVFDRKAPIGPGKYVLASVDGTTMVRRYKQTGLKAFELVPANPDFPTIKSTDGVIELVAVMVESRKYW